VEIDLQVINEQLVKIEDAAKEALEKHNGFLRELGLPILPG
jgi:type I restriction enzyme M protein